MTEAAAAATVSATTTTKKEDTAAPLPTEADLDRADACVCEAATLLARNDVAGAVAALRAALAACADACAALLLLRMVCLCDPARVPAAGASPDVLQRRLDRAPDARYARAEALLAAHDRGTAVATEEDRVWAVLRAAWLAYVRGRPADALALYRAAAAARPDDWSAELVRSVACTNAGATLEQLSSAAAPPESAPEAATTSAPSSSSSDASSESSAAAAAAAAAAEAARWYDLGAAHGNSVAQLNVALQQLAGVPGVRAADAPAAVRTLARLAAAGLAPAQLHYAWCLAHGTGEGGDAAPDDAAAAAVWLRRAAEQRHVPAMRRLGEWLRDGRGTADGAARDDAGAALWLRRAARRGDAHAQLALAQQYHARRVPGVPDAECDYEAAVALECAAAQRLPAAAYELALCHAHGRGVPRNARAAAALLADAAAAGLAAAQTTLGLCYAQGIGVPRDPEAAATWLARAARQNEPTALRVLASGTVSPAPASSTGSSSASPATL